MSNLKWKNKFFFRGWHLYHPISALRVNSLASNLEQGLLLHLDSMLMRTICYVIEHRPYHAISMFLVPNSTEMILFLHENLLWSHEKNVLKLLINEGDTEKTQILSAVCLQTFVLCNNFGVTGRFPCLHTRQLFYIFFTFDQFKVDPFKSWYFCDTVRAPA